MCHAVSPSIHTYVDVMAIRFALSPSRGVTFIRLDVDTLGGRHMVKTTVNLEDDLWKKFSIKVIQDYGGRKKTEIFEALAEAFVNTPKKTIEEAVRDWLAEEKKRQAKAKK